MNLKTFVLLTLALGVAACGKSNNAATGVVIVNTVTADYASSASGQEFSFISKPFRSSELSFRVGGPILDLDVYAGNRYAKGQTIARIDDRDFVIRKERAQAAYTQAKAEYERIAALYDKNSISKSAFDRALAEQTSAKTALQAATNELNDTRLVAPFDGYVGEVFVEKFQDVKATQRVVTFVELDRLKVEAYVTQRVAFQGGKVKQLSLAFDADPTKDYTARVIEISKSTTNNNLSYLLTAELPNSDGHLLAGMSGRVKIELDNQSIDSTVVVPQAVLCHRPTLGDYLWVVDGATSKVSRRAVTLGKLMPGGMVAIEKGLARGEMVASSSLRFLSDDMVVELKNQESETDQKKS